MLEPFVRLEQWLRAPAPPQTCAAPLDDPPCAFEMPDEETLHSALRRLRAAVLEALESPDADALARIRAHADALLEEDA